MGIRHDIEQGLDNYKITKIDGQPKDEDLNLLTKELTNVACQARSVRPLACLGYCGQRYGIIFELYTLFYQSSIYKILVLALTT